MAAVILNVSAARRGEPCISVNQPHFPGVERAPLAPADAAALARDLQDAADWASELDAGEPGEGAPDVLDDAGIV